MHSIGESSAFALGATKSWPPQLWHLATAVAKNLPTAPPCTSSAVTSGHSYATVIAQQLTTPAPSHLSVQLQKELPQPQHQRKQPRWSHKSKPAHKIPNGEATSPQATRQELFVDAPEGPSPSHVMAPLPSMWKSLATAATKAVQPPFGENDQ